MTARVSVVAKSKASGKMGRTIKRVNVAMIMALVCHCAPVGIDGAGEHVVERELG